MPEIGEKYQHCYQDAFLMAVPMFRKSSWWLWGDRCHQPSRSSQFNNGKGDPVGGSD
jgi:hypothetical protein